MELGPLPYPRKRTAPTVSRSPKAASGAAAMHGVLYHRSGVFSICCPTECFADRPGSMTQSFLRWCERAAPRNLIGFLGRFIFVRALRCILAMVGRELTTLRSNFGGGCKRGPLFFRGRVRGSRKHGQTRFLSSSCCPVYA
jgi:hypothetical protein